MNTTELTTESPADPHRLARDVLDPHFAEGGVYAIRFWKGEFWRWSGTHYAALPLEDLRAMIAARAREIFEQLGPMAPENGKGSPKLLKVTTALVGNVVLAMQGLTLLNHDVEWPVWLGNAGPERRDLIAFANGLTTLEDVLADTVQLEPHNPRWFSPAALATPWQPGAKCDKWIAFLCQMLEDDEGRIMLLQEFAGYLLTPDTSLHKFLLLVGEGANGKSVAITVLTRMLGEANVSAVPLEIFGQRFALTATIGKLLNVCSDAGELDKIAEGHIKAFTAGDRMMLDRKHIAPIEIRPTARLMVACNNRPRFSDKSEGIWRRLLYLPFTVTIPTSEQNPHLADELGDELPGILQWAVSGLRRLHQQKVFTIGEKSAEGLADYKAEANPARQFLVDGYEVCDGLEVPTAELYGEYAKWCGANGYHALGERAFGKEVARAFPAVTRRYAGSRGARYHAYLGIMKRD